MNREEMIQNLVVERFHQIIEQRRGNWLLGVLENGFKGYAHLGETELALEALILGIHAGLDGNTANEAELEDGNNDEFTFISRICGKRSEGGHASD